MLPDLPDELLEEIMHFACVQDPEEADSEFRVDTRLRRRAKPLALVCKRWWQIVDNLGPLWIVGVDNPHVVVLHGSLTQEKALHIWTGALSGSRKQSSLDIGFSVLKRPWLDMMKTWQDEIDLSQVILTELESHAGRIWRMDLQIPFADSTADIFNILVPKLSSLEALTFSGIEAFDASNPLPQDFSVDMTGATNLSSLRMANPNILSMIHPPSSLRVLYLDFRGWPVPAFSMGVLVSLAALVSILQRCQDLRKLTILSFRINETKTSTFYGQLSSGAQSLEEMELVTTLPSFVGFASLYGMAGLICLTTLTIEVSYSLPDNYEWTILLPSLEYLCVDIHTWSIPIERFIHQVPPSTLTTLAIIFRRAPRRGSSWKSPLPARNLRLEFHEKSEKWREILANFNFERVESLVVRSRAVVTEVFPFAARLEALSFPALESVELVNLTPIDTEGFCYALVAPKLKTMKASSYEDNHPRIVSEKSPCPFPRIPKFKGYPKIYNTVTSLTLPTGVFSVGYEPDWENPLSLFPNLESLTLHLILDKFGGMCFALGSLSSKPILLPRLEELAVFVRRKNHIFDQELELDSVAKECQTSLKQVIKWRKARDIPLKMATLGNWVGDDAKGMSTIVWCDIHAPEPHTPPAVLGRMIGWMKLDAPGRG